jgi:hypothetical protein
MAALFLTTPPDTLRRWLRQSLYWTALGCLVTAVAWYLYRFFPKGSGQAGSAVGVFLLLLVHVRITFVLFRQVRCFEPIYQRHQQATPWLLRAAAQIWWFLLSMLTVLWVIADAALLLVWLLAAADDGRSSFGLLTAGRAAWA